MVEYTVEMITKALRLVLLLALITSSGFGQSAWDYQGINRKEKISFHRKTAAREGGIVTLWIKIGHSGKSQLAFDCTNNKVRMLFSSGKDGLVGDWSEFFPVAPDTRGEWLHKKACRYRPDRNLDH